MEHDSCVALLLLEIPRRVAQTLGDRTQLSLSAVVPDPGALFQEGGLTRGGESPSQKASRPGAGSPLPGRLLTGGSLHE